MAVGLGLGTLGATAPARAESPPVITDGPTIEGAAQEGATLTARASWTGNPAPKTRWVWARCAPLGTPCSKIADATTPTYAVTATDVGKVIIVRLTVLNSVGTEERQASPTAVVTAAPAPGPAPGPTPTPGPTPGPEPAPTPGPPIPPAPSPIVKPEGSTTQSGTGDSVARAPGFDLAPAPAPAAPVVAGQETRPTRSPMFDPFPIIRIKGLLTSKGARVTLLTVNAPRQARVTVLCHGAGCPLRQLARVSTASTMHLRAFERELRQGTRLEIAITRPGYVGKSTVIVIQRGRAPTRRDQCLVPGKSRAVPCPTS
jgi:hypothetical protein